MTSRPRTDVEVVVVGAGTVGLACAAVLARSGRDVVVLERNDGPAKETSSRNSGVIHAGLYYPPGSLKARSCVEGRALLYGRCVDASVPHRKTGKLVVATAEDERPRLEALRRRALANGVPVEPLTADEVSQLEPKVRAIAGLWSPESGIVDVHALSLSYLAEARDHGASFAFRTELTGLRRRQDDWLVRTSGPDGAIVEITAHEIVNAAGLGADHVAALAGVPVDALGWRQRYCKGDYFAFAPRLGALTRHLVYPLPTEAGLGVHVTMDLAGAYRAGPDTEYVDAPRYDVDPKKARAFAAALSRYLPEVRAEDLRPDYAGIRPKRNGPGEPARDFVLEEHPDAPGMVHLIGIESPGITASEALALRVLARLQA